MNDLTNNRGTGFLLASPLNAKRFETFGDVLENPGPLRRRDFAQVFVSSPSSRPSLWVNRLEPTTDKDIVIEVMERHPYSSQTFLPLDAGRFLIALALSGGDGLPDLTTLRAFISRGSQGVRYRPNIWHYAFTSLDSVMQVAVIQSASGREDDTVVTRLSTPIPVGVAVPLDKHSI